MLSRNAVRECALVASAVIICAAGGAKAQSFAYHGSLAPSGQYADMPGQPGVPVHFSNNQFAASPQAVQAQYAPPAQDLPPTVVVEAPGNDNTAAAQTSPIPAPAPVPQQPIIYHPPAAEPEYPLEPASPPYMSLATRPGVDIGVQVSDYRFREPGAGVKVSGPNYGGVIDGTAVFPNRFFGTLEGRFAAGWLDYSGLGDLDDRTNYIAEGRGIVGRDFLYEYFSFSPFTGLGYRDLMSELKGTTNIGTKLYDFDEGMLYLPIGFMDRFHIDEASRLATSLEYDFLLNGQAESHLGDQGAGDPTVNNLQHDGFGVRGEVMYETKYWSLGPFASFWSLGSSKASVYHSPGSTCGSSTCSLIIPYNHSVEAGLQFKYHLF